MELKRKQKIQNILFILLNSFLVMLGFCFIAIKIDDDKLIRIILFSIYCLLAYCFGMNIIDLHNKEKQLLYEELKKYYKDKENDTKD